MVNAPAYDVAKAFLGAWRSAIARSQLQPGSLVRAHMIPGVLVVQVTALPDGVLDPDFLAHGPGQARSLFTIRGEQFWMTLTELAMTEAQRACADMLAAVILHPEAIRSARSLRREAA